MTPPWSFPPLLPRCWAYAEGRKHPVPLGGAKRLCQVSRFHAANTGPRPAEWGVRARMEPTAPCEVGLRRRGPRRGPDSRHTAVSGILVRAKAPPPHPKIPECRWETEAQRQPHKNLSCVKERHGHTARACWTGAEGRRQLRGRGRDRQEAHPQMSLHNHVAGDALVPAAACPQPARAAGLPARPVA